EITNAHREKIPPDYIRRQTLSNAERFVTPELKEKEELILGAQDKIHELEYKIFEELRGKVQEQTAQIQELAGLLARVDALASLTEAALRGGYVRPQIDGSDMIEIRGGRHPVLENLMNDRPFVPNDVCLDKK